MWFWVIRVFWKEGAEEQEGLLTLPVPSDREDVLAYNGVVVFNNEKEAQTYLEDRPSSMRSEPTPLRHTNILKTLESSTEGTPDCIFYLGGYQKGDTTGAPLTSAQFRAVIEGNTG